MTGFGAEDFNQTLMGLARVHDYFRSVFPDKICPFEPFDIDGNLALASSTRYFHSRHHNRSATPQAFGPGVDPHGILDKMGGETYIHTEDNVVQFLGRKTDDGKNFKYVVPCL